MQLIVYVSRATQPFSDGELESMCSRFSQNNQAAGITGALVRLGDYFFQAFEGTSEQRTSCTRGSGATLGTPRSQRSSGRRSSPACSAGGR